tara:strand:+ start:38 stop:508 length:471 start_codon:yes stop_codon:yes gene_type:complete
MKKIIFLISLFSFTLNAQKSIGTIKTGDEITKKAIEANQAYLNQDFSVWDEIISDDAIIYVNNSKMDKNSYVEGFKSHHAIFNNISYLNSYSHTNYFKSGDIWSNTYLTWIGTGNASGLRYSNRGVFNQKWQEGKVIEIRAYFDSATLEAELSAMK